VNASPIGRAVVTGGAGFLGSHICERLLNDGWDVLCLDNFLTSAPRNIGHLQSNPRFQLIRMDVADYIERSRRHRCYLPLRFAGIASRLPGGADTDDESWLARDGKGQKRPICARIHLSGLRQSRGSPAVRVLLRPRQSHRTAQRL